MTSKAVEMVDRMISFRIIEIEIIFCCNRHDTR